MSPVTEAAPVTSMAMAMFFGTAIFATTVMTVTKHHSGSLRDVLRVALSPKSTALDIRSFESVYTALYHSSVMGIILLYAYICEYHPPFPHADKSYDRDEFFFLTALLILVSTFTIHKHEPDLLNREQTEEWKGWMQFMFLLYHYFHAEEVYNSIRIMITCYVWMTGFGNFSFFYLKSDFGLVRVLQMLWRLNFLVLFLCLTQGTTYILYYICLLHTYFFGMVYVTMRIGKEANHTQWGIRLKLAVLAVIIFLVWDVDTGLFQLIHGMFLGDQPILGATSGAMWEWYFRSSLDHWSTFLGMIFALNFPITTLFFEKVEDSRYNFAAKAAVGAVLLAATVLWVRGPFRLQKFDYNQTNSYYGVVPVLCYIFFRNLTPKLRSHSMGLLVQIGKTTLETYLMQHHIWLTSNAKSLLTLVPGWPKMNFLVVSIIYYLVSRRLYQLTLFLRGMILPNNKALCIRNLLYMTAALVAYVGVASVLRLVGLLNLFTVFLVSVCAGAALLTLISKQTATPILPPMSPETFKEANLYKTKLQSAASGAFVLLFIGCSWYILAHHGAGKIQPLPRTCGAHVQRGLWIPTNVCNEATKGAGLRDFGVDSLGTCDAKAWGWEKTASNELCRFTRRDAKSIRKALWSRNVTFVGDSIVRHVYHAFCRQIGDSTAGRYNTTMGKWSDFSREYESTALEFRWAPFVGNLTNTVATLRREESHPDLIVIGGGAWDRLHMYTTEADKSKLESGVKALARDLSMLSRSVPVVWIEPTTVNSWGLMTEQKRQNIREDQMKILRSVYKDAGIPDSVTYVLDGTSFTADRVQESYDGVHYPLSVYDGGAQILANSLDWLLLPTDRTKPFHAPTPGSMDNPLLGLFMLCFVGVAVIYFDGFMGASYLGALLVPSAAPKLLYAEAFGALHGKMGLTSTAVVPSATATPLSDPRLDKSKESDHNLDSDLSEGRIEEEALLGRVEMASTEGKS